MYEATGREQVVAIEPALPEAATGDPSLRIVTTRSDVVVAYWIARPEVYLIEDSEREPDVAVVRFCSVRALYLGSPNDEALHGHPLYEHGLKHYTFAEVKDSPWIASLERRNRVHPRHSASRFSTLRHFVLPFHDETFECVAEGVESELIAAEDPARALRDISLGD